MQRTDARSKLNTTSLSKNSRHKPLRMPKETFKSLKRTFIEKIRNGQKRLFLNVMKSTTTSEQSTSKKTQTRTSRETSQSNKAPKSSTQSGLRCRQRESTPISQRFKS